jgi:uncharacterized membrane protein required for colicin V production
VNWLLLAVVIFLAVYAIRGRQEGFIKTVFSIFSILIALVLTYEVQPYVSKALQHNDKIVSYVEHKVDASVELDKKEEGVSDQRNSIEGLRLPKSLKKSLIENNNTEVYKALVVEKFEDYVSSYLAVVILNALSFVGVFLIVYILLFIISRAMDILSHLPLINGLNKTAGLLVGLLRGLVVIWILCILLTMFSSTKTSQILYGYINDSYILSSIYDNNILLHIITNIAKVLF